MPIWTAMCSRTAARLWLERFQRPDDESFTIVAELDREVVGVADTRVNRDPEWGALLDNLHVRFDLKRQGVGRALVTDAGSRPLGNAGRLAVCTYRFSRKTRPPRLFTRRWAGSSSRTG